MKKTLSKKTRSHEQTHPERLHQYDVGKGQMKEKHIDFSEKAKGFNSRDLDSDQVAESEMKNKRPYI